MNAISILYGGNLAPQAQGTLFNGKNSLELAKEQASRFPGVTKTVVIDGNDWTKQSLLNKIAFLQEGYDFAYFAFADCPFLDPELAGKLAERHTRFKAEYSYADGYPGGLAPELLAPGTAAILSKILDGSHSIEEENSIKQGGRDIIFSVLRKDINAFDIETEISEIDLRCHRLNFFADSKRNLLLLKNFINAHGSIPNAEAVEKIIETKPGILRTLPAFYPIQIYGGCPGSDGIVKCEHCPYPSVTDAAGRKDFMETSDFNLLLGKIINFSEDAVIGISLWGEPSLHPDIFNLIDDVLCVNRVSLVIETSGIGWNVNDFEKEIYIRKSDNLPSPHAPKLSWIVSITNSESEETAKKLFELYPKDTYVQKIRVKGSEDETEKFFRYWKGITPYGEKNIIIQKYDDFCGVLEKKQASDISPVIRGPCWHITRDMPVLIDGTVPLCRSDLKNTMILGNAFSEPLEYIWNNGIKYYDEHCRNNYPDLCSRCDEYYTYNF